MNAVTSQPCPQVSAAESSPPESSLLLFDDAVAIVDLGLGTLIWASDPWLEVQPELGLGTAVAQIVQTLPTAANALRVHNSKEDPQVNIEANAESEPGQWAVQAQSIGGQRIALRLTDQREHGRAMARQLHDRESLLFTSRVLSVGEMAATLAHELNQPIAAAANLLRGLRARLSRRTKALTKEESGALDKTLEQVMFASQVISRIREFTVSHQPRPKDFDLASLIRQSASLLDWDLQRTNVNLTLLGVDAPITVRGDDVMLQQVLINLMRNAIDALRTDPPIVARLTVTLIEQPQRVEVQISDNGCGLADGQAARLFVPFASSKPTGMGLGLSICRSFIELHQGRLWFSRNSDRGTTFHFALPVSPSEPTPTARRT